MAEKSPKDTVGYKTLTDFSIEKICKSSSLSGNLCEVIKSHPDETARNLGMSIIHLLNCEYDKTLECLEFLERSHPEIPLIHRRIAQIYIDENEYEKAVSYLEKALMLDGGDQTAKIWLGLIYYATGDEIKGRICFDFLKEDIFFLYASNSSWSVNEK